MLARASAICRMCATRSARSAAAGRGERCVCGCCASFRRCACAWAHASFKYGGRREQSSANSTQCHAYFRTIWHKKKERGRRSKHENPYGGGILKSACAISRTQACASSSCTKAFFFHIAGSCGKRPRRDTIPHRTRGGGGASTFKILLLYTARALKKKAHTHTHTHTQIKSLKIYETSLPREYQRSPPNDRAQGAAAVLALRGRDEHAARLEIVCTSDSKTGSV